APRRLAVGTPAVEGGVGTHVAAEFHAGVGAGNEEEAGAVRRADPYIIDWLGFDRKVGRLCEARCHEADRRPDQKCANRLHMDSCRRGACADSYLAQKASAT